jgi:hypothetical protein
MFLLHWTGFQVYSEIMIAFMKLEVVEYLPNFDMGATRLAFKG